MDIHEILSQKRIFGRPDEDSKKDSDGDGIVDNKDNCYNPGCALVDSRGCS